jgi:hypothetical protein
MAIIAATKPLKIHLPFYVCDSVIKAIEKAGLTYEFYRIDKQLCCAEELPIDESEMVLYINYFGVRTSEISSMIRGRSQNAIVDNSQAFFAGTCGAAYSFNSVRKFIGVPDGGFMVGEMTLTDNLMRNSRYSFDHLILKNAGLQNEAYSAFRRAESMIEYAVMRGSEVSETLLSNINLTNIRTRRNANFVKAHSILSGWNRLTIPETIDGPLAYPLLLDDVIEVRELHAQGLFIPRYWNDVLVRNDQGDRFGLERGLVDRLIPIPIDQRYTLLDIQEICTRLIKVLDLD